MTQAAFLEELDRHLTGLSDEERRRAADFYRELILDGMEDGKTEEEAVEALGSPEAAAARPTSGAAGAEQASGPG